jgi:crotonobetainyl-CoA:carnitine CoA-transferase CaiB-like acyl-CoA transferase
MEPMRPLEGIRVLDFSTLLPGPLATLMLAEAGAEVIKIERPPAGDEMRAYAPRVGGDSLAFAQLNRGKRSVAIDLKADGAVERLTPLIRSADVLIEQFRPGVMDRLGLGFEALSRINPRLVYCSLTGYGRAGPKAHKAAHDLNYVAESGMLALVPREGEAPTLPPALIADIGAGAYPAVINVLMGLLGRAVSGKGCHLDVSMNDNLLPFMYGAVGEGLGLRRWPRPGLELLTGGSPRYNLYRTRDGRYIAAAPLEQKFWVNFCEAIGLPEALRDDSKDPAASLAGVARAIAAHSAAHWRRAFDGVDGCVSVAATLEEAFNDPHYRARGVFAHSVAVDGRALPAAPVPVDASFRLSPGSLGFPRLGEANDLLDAAKP